MLPAVSPEEPCSAAPHFSRFCGAKPNISGGFYRVPSVCEGVPSACEGASGVRQ